MRVILHTYVFIFFHRIPAAVTRNTVTTTVTSHTAPVTEVTNAMKIVKSAKRTSSAPSWAFSRSDPEGTSSSSNCTLHSKLRFYVQLDSL